MPLHTFDAKPLAPEVMTELDKYESHLVTRTPIGYQTIAKVQCRECKKWSDPTWPTLKNLRCLGRNGKCWLCS